MLKVATPALTQMALVFTGIEPHESCLTLNNRHNESLELTKAPTTGTPK